VKKIKSMRFLIYFLIFFAGIVAIPQNSFAEAENSVNIGAKGLVGPYTSASVVFVEYERLTSNKFSILGRIGQLDYEYSGYYIEEGDGHGVEVGFRFYPDGNGMKGFYLGANGGFWFTDWTRRWDVGTSYETKRSSSSTAFDVNFELGGRFGSEKFVIIPTFNIGNSLCISDECSGRTRSLGLGFNAIGLGLALGIGF
jgi:hypothetical protein